MANILLLDDNEVACRALQGILARGNHRGFIATKVDDAWRMLREGVVFDVVFCEVKLAGTSGISFLQRVREDWFWKILPVVVYTSETDSRLVKKALGLRVQNYLIKPYSDELVHNEIAKALQNPWRDLHFEDAKSFAKLTGIEPATLIEMRREVMVGFDKAAQTFPAWAEVRQNEEVFAETSALAGLAEAAGVWGGVDFLRHLQEQAAVGNWSEFKSCAEYLDYASRLIFCQLNPSFSPDCMRVEPDSEQAREAAEYARWACADVDKSGPLTDRAMLEAQVKALGSCPVVDTSAAAFQMVADGRAATMSQVMDLVASDPGLAVQILTAANRCEHDDMTPIEDVRAGASMLGELKLNALAKALPIASERHAKVSPFTWPSYWMYQVAVGRVAEFICTSLEFGYLSGTACTGGLIHDVGRLFLLKLHPFGFQAVLRYARERKVPLAVAERKYFGCTSRELAVHFADSGALPLVYGNVLRWVERPDEAVADMDVVAMVSLARHICIQAHIGTSGEQAVGAGLALATTPAWRVLSQRVFPSFDVRKFEVQAHAYCLTLRAELSGQRSDRRPTHAQRAAELV